MKQKFLFLLFALAGSSLSFSQHKPPGIWSYTYAGPGFFLPSSQMKENSMIGKGVNFSFGYFQSIGKEKNGMQWGIEARLNYSKLEKDLHVPPSASSIPFNNGTGTPVILPMTLITEEKKPDAFQYLLGPSVLISKKHFILQPSIMFGYGSVSQEKFDFYSHFQNPSNTTEDTAINFYHAGHETNNGFVVVPGLKAGYRFNKFFTTFFSFEYSFGSKQKFSDSLYMPTGTPPAGGYDYYQLTHGTTKEYTREGKFRALLINLQLAFTLPRKRP